MEVKTYSSLTPKRFQPIIKNAEFMIMEIYIMYGCFYVHLAGAVLETLVLLLHLKSKNPNDSSQKLYRNVGLSRRIISAILFCYIIFNYARIFNWKGVGHIEMIVDHSCEEDSVFINTMRDLREMVQLED